MRETGPSEPPRHLETYAAAPGTAGHVPGLPPRRLRRLHQSGRAPRPPRRAGPPRLGAWKLLAAALLFSGVLATAYAVHREAPLPATRAGSAHGTGLRTQAAATSNGATPPAPPSAAASTPAGGFARGSAPTPLSISTAGWTSGSAAATPASATVNASPASAAMSAGGAPGLRAANPPSQPGPPAAPAVAAKAYAVMDAKTGAMLAQANAGQPLPPASLAKLVTFDLALRALREGNIGPLSAVPIGPDVRRLAEERGITVMGLDRAEATVPFEDLIFGMMLPSGNDAALAIADYLGGNQTAFSVQMNALVRTLRMTHSHFANPSGLPSPDQLTSAADMAVLARHIWQRYPGFRRYTAAKTYRWNGTALHNLDPLLGTDPRVLGMKGGWLSASGFNLVTIASQGQQTVVVAVLGSPTFQASADASERFLNWALTQPTPADT